MRKRIPFLFAALLVAALVTVVGLAAFSINSSEEPPAEEVAFDGAISGRVASAVLAASVSAPPLEQAPTGSVEVSVPEVADADSVETETAPTAGAPSTTASPSTTTAADTSPPPLLITHPEDGGSVTYSVVEFTGTSEAGATVASGPFDATMGDDGSWSIKLVVTAGYNTTVFTATDSAGNDTSERIVVFYEPPTPTTTKAPPPTTTKPPSPATTKPPSPTTTTTTKPPSGNCPVHGSCSSQWPADAKASHGRDYWRPLVEQYWGSERAACVLDLIQVESNGNPQARSPGGNYLGLLQHSFWLWNGRAEAIGLVDSSGLTAHPYNGEANIAAGAWLADRSSPWWKPWPPTKRIASCQALGAG